MLEQIARVFQGLSLLTVFAGFWILVMICVPIVRWTAGAGAERIGIAAGVFAQVAVVIVTLAAGLGPYALVVVVSVPVLGWASEVLGSRTGFPFGSYTYTNVLQPQLADVPVLIPLAWLMMMPPSWAVGASLAPNNPVAQWAIAAAAFTAWDVYLDPLMVGWDFWRWKRRGWYLGIPLTNYLGWFAVAFVITAALALLAGAVGIPLLESLPTGPMLLVFVITWILQFIGQFAFWKLHASAVAGLLAMGVFVVLLILRLGL